MILAFSLMCFKKAPQIGKPAYIASAKTPPQNGWSGLGKASDA